MWGVQSGRFQVNGSKKRFEGKGSSETVWNCSKLLNKMSKGDFKSSFQVPSCWGFPMGLFWTGWESSLGGFGRHSEVLCLDWDVCWCWCVSSFLMMATWTCSIETKTVPSFKRATEVKSNRKTCGSGWKSTKVPFFEISVHLPIVVFLKGQHFGGSPSPGLHRASRCAAQGCSYNHNWCECATEATCVAAGMDFLWALLAVFLCFSSAQSQTQPTQAERSGVPTAPVRSIGGNRRCIWPFRLQLPSRQGCWTANETTAGQRSRDEGRGETRRNDSKKTKKRHGQVFDRAEWVVSFSFLAITFKIFETFLRRAEVSQGIKEALDKSNCLWAAPGWRTLDAGVGWAFFIVFRFFFFSRFFDVFCLWLPSMFGFLGVNNQLILWSFQHHCLGDEWFWSAEILGSLPVRQSDSSETVNPYQRNKATADRAAWRPTILAIPRTVSNVNWHSCGSNPPATCSMNILSLYNRPNQTGCFFSSHQGTGVEAGWSTVEQHVDYLGAGGNAMAKASGPCFFFCCFFQVGFWWFLVGFWWFLRGLGAKRILKRCGV